MDHRLAGTGATVLALILLGHVTPARAAWWDVCSGMRTDDTTRPIPPTMAPAVVATFKLHMTTAEITRNGVYRCVDGQVYACMTGANLNCGKANTQMLNRGGDFWCRQHPDAASIPFFATGHDSIYAWRCDGSRAVIARQVSHVDARGFTSENWRRLAH